MTSKSLFCRTSALNQKVLSDRNNIETHEKLDISPSIHRHFM